MSKKPPLYPHITKSSKGLAQVPDGAEMASSKRLSDLHSWAASGESYLKGWLEWKYLPRELTPLTAQAADILHDLASFMERYMK